MSAIRITVWNEFQHEKVHETVKKVYPDGIHTVIAEGLTKHGFADVRTATLDEPDHGLTPEVLAETDVLVWWGHMAHGKVRDEIVDRVHRRVLEGMGMVVLHSGHHSKIFRKLMGTSCSLRWREAGEHERIWVVDPAHPIADGFGPYFELPEEEMYGELFDIPTPDALVFISWFPGGEVFRSGCCFHRGRGKIFYFRPGHETHPTYYHPDVQKVIANGARWAAQGNGPAFTYGDGGAFHAKVPLEPLATMAASEPAAPATRAATLSLEPQTPDDLRLIEGIGPRISEILNNAKIQTFAALAAASVDELRQILLAAGLRVNDPTTWPDQAALAADGQWEELKALQDQLVGGRRA